MQWWIFRKRYLFEHMIKNNATFIIDYASKKYSNAKNWQKILYRIIQWVTGTQNALWEFNNIARIFSIFRFWNNALAEYCEIFYSRQKFSSEMLWKSSINPGYSRIFVLFIKLFDKISYRKVNFMKFLKNKKMLHIHGLPNFQ